MSSLHTVFESCCILSPKPAAGVELPKYINDYIDIPPVFHSQATGGRFERCISCDIALLEDGTQYLIEKAYRRYPGFDVVDTVFEYAMCMDCFLQLQSTLSKDSLQKVEAYFNERVNLFERRAQLLEDSKFDLDKWIGTCMISGTPKQEAEEFQIYAHCDGNDLLFTLFPYMISGAVIDEIAGLLSNQTLGEIDGFMGEHFGLPPEFKPRLIPI